MTGISKIEKLCLKSTRQGPVVGSGVDTSLGPHLSSHSTQAGGPSQSSLFTTSLLLARDDRPLPPSFPHLSQTIKM